MLIPFKGVSSISLSWDPVKNVDGYSVQRILPLPYPKLEPVFVKKNEIVIKNASPGVEHAISVCDLFI